jgi:hypothetical protein
MQFSNGWIVVVPVVAGLHLAACQRAPEAPHKVVPFQVQHLEGQEVSRITLTPPARQRLDIKTDAVRDVPAAPAGARRKGVPYAAVLYDASGNTWVYSSPEPLVFVRQRIVVDHIEGDVAVLSDGPPAGTTVVTTGAADLFGTEFAVGH